MSQQNRSWRNYEEVAQFLLDQLASHFGLGRVEGKQIVRGESTEWELDARGVLVDGDGFVAIECKRHKHRVRQGQIGELFCKIHDTGAVGGIIVSPLPLQAGASKFANNNLIVQVRLDRNCTTTEYILEFINKLFIGLSQRSVVCDHLEAKLIHSDNQN